MVLVTRVSDPLKLLPRVVNAGKGHVELIREPRRKSRSANLPSPTNDDRGMGPLSRLGQRRAVGQLIVFTVVVKRRPGRCRPESRDDLQLLSQPVESLLHRGERYGVSGVLLSEPSRANAEFNAAATHLICLGHRDGEWARQAKGGRRHERAEPNAVCLARERRDRHPSVRWTRESGVRTHLKIVVGSKEGGEAESFGLQRDSQQIVVRGTLLGFGEDS